MPTIPIHNETDFDLTDAMLKQIERDAWEYFGESIRAIRIQYGIERHAFNAKTGELRYSFSPGDFGLVDEAVSVAEPYHYHYVPSIDDEDEVESDESAYDDVDVDEDEEEDTTPDLEDLTEDLSDDDDGAARFQSLEDDLVELEPDDDDILYDDTDVDDDDDDDDEYE